MTDVVELKTRLHRNPAFTRAYNALPLTSTAITTPQRALSDKVTPAALRAVADWNQRKGYDARFRPQRMRHKAQCVALRNVADEIERGAVREAA